MNKLKRSHVEKSMLKKYSELWLTRDALYTFPLLHLQAVLKGKIHFTNKTLHFLNCKDNIVDFLYLRLI